MIDEKEEHDYCRKGFTVATSSVVSSHVSNSLALAYPDPTWLRKVELESVDSDSDGDTGSCSFFGSYLDEVSGFNSAKTSSELASNSRPRRRTSTAVTKVASTTISSSSWSSKSTRTPPSASNSSPTWSDFEDYLSEDETNEDLPSISTSIEQLPATTSTAVPPGSTSEASEAEQNQTDTQHQRKKRKMTLKEKKERRRIQWRASYHRNRDKRNVNRQNRMKNDPVYAARRREQWRLSGVRKRERAARNSNQRPPQQSTSTSKAKRDEQDEDFIIKVTLTAMGVRKSSRQKDKPPKSYCEP